jgi:hypothetical protein
MMASAKIHIQICKQGGNSLSYINIVRAETSDDAEKFTGDGEDSGARNASQRA